MALELRQQLKLTQQLIMTPQLQMAIKLLQLSRLELMETIRTELEENPALEEVSESTSAEQLVEQTDPEFADYTLRESLKAASEHMKNGADYLKFVKLNFSSGRKSAKFIAEMKGGKDYEWSSSALYEEGGKYWGRSTKARQIKRRKKKK